MIRLEHHSPSFMDWFLSDAAHDVQIFLVGEATYTMRKATVDAIHPVGGPPLSETLDKVVAKRIPMFA